MWKHRIFTFLSTSKFVKISSAANRIHVSRRTEARVFSIHVSTGNVVAGLRVEGANPTAAGQEIVQCRNAVSNNQMISLDNVDAYGEAVLRSDSQIIICRGEHKKLLKQRQYEVRKAEIVAAGKERRRIEGERKRKAWDEKLASVGEEERLKLIEERRCLRMETIMKINAEKAQKIERLEKARQHGQNIVIDLEFAHIMSPLDIKSLTRQVIFCYAANGRSCSPSHLWLTGCSGDIETQFSKIPGYENWIIEKERRSYIEIFAERKDDLVYLTPDSETILDDLDPKKLYIIGGLVDRTRQKGITVEKAKSQKIQTAKLPIREYLKESSCQILAINQVVELLVKFKDTRDWKTSFYHAVPQRKQSQE